MTESEGIALFTRPKESYSGSRGRKASNGHDKTCFVPTRKASYADSSCNSDDSSSGTQTYEGDTQSYQHYSGGPKSASHILSGPRVPKKGRNNSTRIDPKPPSDERKKDKSFNDILSDVHEKALEATGFGHLQYVLLVVLGLGIMGDAIELMVMAYILPGAERELCMDNQMKGWLGAIAFAGMMLGAPLWGVLSDKIGRRRALISSLCINVLFSLVGAVMPYYWLFVSCRLVAGIGIGGSIPVVFAYFAEFCPVVNRGRRLGILLLFWVFGGLYVAGLGWTIIPKTNLSFVLNDSYTFGSWRLFLVICTVPIILCILGLLAMPESPRYLLQVGRDLEALEVYRQIFEWNRNEKGIQYEMPEIELPSSSNVNIDIPGYGVNKGLCADIIYGLENFWASIFQLFYPPLTTVTTVLCVSWFSLAFGYYGLTIWFPEYVKLLELEEYHSHQKVISGVDINNKIITSSLTNQAYVNTTFHNVTWRDLILDHVTFDTCHLEQCVFFNVSSVITFFQRSSLVNTQFNYTDITESHFTSCSFKGVHFGTSRPGCQIDYDTAYSTKKVFLENFLGQLAVLPGTALTAFLLDRAGRVWLMAASQFLSGISVFFIWFCNTEAEVVAVNCVFNFVVVGAWNTLDVISTELYPTHIRSTAVGFQSCLGRIAAILGNVCFGQLIGISKAIPILLTACVMAMGGFLTLKLPESKDKLI